MGVGWGTGIIRNVRVEGHEDTDWRMPVFEVDDDFIDFYRMEVVRGRAFDLDAFPSDSSGAYIVNEAAVQAFGWDDPGSGSGAGPIGKELTWVDREIPGTVVGVVKDYHYGPLTERIGPAVMTVYTKQLYNLTVRINPPNVEETLAHFEEQWKRFVDKGVPFDHLFWDQQFEQMYWKERRAQSLTFVASGVAILLACLGLFGLASFAVAERKKEIGVRKSLGATVGNILVLVSREFLLMVVIAAAIAAPVAWSAMSGWLQNFVYRTEIGAGVFLVGTLTALVIAQATVAYHAVRAARLDPVKALRYE